MCVCAYCKRKFEPSRYRPDQKVCSMQECQRRRRREYHKKRRAEDPAYHEQCLDSQRKWRKKNPDYLKSYRAGRARSRLLRKLHELRDLVKNNVALDIRSCDASIWIVGPKGLISETNNLAGAEVIVLQVVAHAAFLRRAEKNIFL